jgi:hypothetical protein
MGRDLVKQPGVSSPIGFRIFTPDDWIIRIEYADGTVFRKGVDGAVSEEEAVRVALQTARFTEIPKDVDARRRRDWSRIQL